MGASCAEELIRVKVLLDVDWYFQIRVNMKDGEKIEHCYFLYRM